MTSGESLVALDQVNCRGVNGELLLDSVSWQIGHGESWGLTGPSGAGKTLLMRTLSLLDPFEGELYWRGKPVAPQRVPEYRANVIYVAQAATLLEGTVESNLQAPFQLQIHAQKSYPEKMISDGFTGFGKHRAFLQSQSSELSGGERQIVALLRALILEPVILLLDEATSALDPTSKGVAEMLIDNWMKADVNRSVVWVTHDEAQRRRVTRQELRIQSGRVIEGAVT